MVKFLHIFVISVFAFLGSATAQNGSGTPQQKSKNVEIVGTIPKNGATNVKTTPTLQIEFNQEIKKGEGSIYICNSYGRIIIDIDINDEEVEIVGNKVVVSLFTELEPEEDYHVEIDEKAIAGNENNYFPGIASDKKWYFSTYSLSSKSNAAENIEPAFYPNPAHNTIHLTGQELVEEIQIINLTGKLVFSETSQKTSLNISNLPQGMYIVSFLQKNGHRISKKLIKK